MVYRAIGLMSGSSLDGLDIVLAEFSNQNTHWYYHIVKADCIEFSDELKHKLKTATLLPAREYLLLDTEFGHYCGQAVNHFLSALRNKAQVDLIASHGHTTFHLPRQKMTAQLGDGASIAAITGIKTVTDLRAMDVALGGQGAPIIPVGEKLLFPNNEYFLNLGGIANVSVHRENEIIAFDVCPANRVLNLLAAEKGLLFDKDGDIAKTGKINERLLKVLNEQDYYFLKYPKSLANDFGTDVIYPLIKKSGISVADAMATVCEHIAYETERSLKPFATKLSGNILITGGGAFNNFLVGRISHHLSPLNIKTTMPSAEVINYKEALVMALMGILRVREEENVFSSVTGASGNSIGGAVWAAKNKAN